MRSASPSTALSETTGLSNQVETAAKDIKLPQVTWKQVAGRRTILLASPQRGKLQDNFTFCSSQEFNKAGTLGRKKKAPYIEETSSSGILSVAEELDHEI